MLSERIKQFRLAKGWSLDELAAAVGGIVSKNALSKYERNLMQPSLSTLAKIAKALDTKVIHLKNPPVLSTEFIAYRKGSGLGKKQEEKIESFVKTELEERIKLQEKLGPIEAITLPVGKYKINKIEDAETAANKLRDLWQLGSNPIANITALLERHQVHVIFIETHEKFDGISSVTKNEKGKYISAAVVSRSGVPGGRQRLNLAHELGHLVLAVSPSIDEEKAAFRFGAALLAPQESLFDLIGKKRSSIQFAELIHFKKYFGISIQALIYRLSDLNIITESYMRRLFQIINKKGWRKAEPAELDPEKPVWLENAVMRAFSENIISASEANRLLEHQKFESRSLSLKKKTKFLKLNEKDRSEILVKEAKIASDYYNKNQEWKEFILGDIIEYAGKS